ncbi:MAG: hypothetical protein V1875_08225 [Candidatus Altiarchaeota archaeon]
MAHGKIQALNDDEMRRLILGQDPLNDTRIGAPQQELRLGQLNCFRRMDDPLSQTMAREIRDECRFDTFDRVMRALVYDGMGPLNAEDMGVWVSWLLQNVPYERKDGEKVLTAKSRMSNSHRDATTRLGCWHFAASRDADPQMKADVGIVMRTSLESFFRGADREHPSNVLKGFGGLERAVEGLKVISQPLPPDFDIFDPVDDRSYLTPAGLEEAKRPGASNPSEGWYREPGTLRSVDLAALKGTDTTYGHYERRVASRMGRGIGYVRECLLDIRVKNLESALKPAPAAKPVPGAVEPVWREPQLASAPPQWNGISLADKLMELGARFGSVAHGHESRGLAECFNLEAAGQHQALAEELMGVIECQLGIEIPNVREIGIPLEKRIIRVMAQCMKIGRKDVSNPVAEFAIRYKKPGEEDIAIERLLDAVDLLSRPKSQDA